MIVTLLLAFTSIAPAQLFTVDMVSVPASDDQPGGPTYDYEVARTEVTNAEFAAFLNDAEFHNETQNPGFGDERGANIPGSGSDRFPIPAPVR